MQNLLRVAASEKAYKLHGMMGSSKKRKNKFNARDETKLWAPNFSMALFGLSYAKSCWDVKSVRFTKGDPQNQKAMYTTHKPGVNS